MESIVGIFNSLADAKRGAAMLRALGIAENRITVLAPHTSEAEVQAQIPATDTEQPGMGQAMGGTVGGALGVAGGATAGAAAASLLVPGVGPVLAFESEARRPELWQAMRWRNRWRMDCRTMKSMFMKTHCAAADR